MHPSFALVLVASLFASASVYAAPTPHQPPPRESGAVNLLTDPELRNWIYGGANLGIANLQTDGTLPESDKSGFQLNLKLLYSRYFDRWVIDLGGGFLYNRVSGDDQFSTLLNPKVKVSTRAGFAEISPRYRFDENWQAGAVVNALFGTDVSFDESTNLDSDAFNLLIGPRIDYEIPAGAGRWRFGAQVMTDLTIQSRQLWLVQADIQYGIPLGEKGEDRPEPPVAHAPPPPPHPAPPARPPTRPVAPRFAEITPERGVKIYLGEAVLRFRTARYDLRPSSREVLTKLAGYLKRADSAWKSMRVEGHTDIRGKLAYNERLAVQRATTVKNQLIRLGLPGEKLSVAGFGPRRPIDSADDLEAYALNRRVEIWLDGVSNPETVIRELNDLK